MAKKKNDDLSFLNPSLNKKIAQQVQKDLDTSYSNTYFTNNDDSKMLDTIRNRIDKDLNNLIDKTRLRNSGNNISTLYARTLASNEEDTFKEFKHALQDESMLTDLMDMYSQNAVQRDLDREIDVVCKYVPKLAKALDLKMKHVLSADHFNKDNMEITLVTSETGKNSNSMSNDVSSQYAVKSDIEAFKKKYDLLKLTKKIYQKTAKYGEDMIYIISYNKALQRLLRKTGRQADGLLTEDAIEEIMSNNKNFTIAYLNESVEENNHFDSSKQILTENFYDYDSIDNNTKTILDENSNYDKINIEYNDSGVIPSALNEIMVLKRFSDNIDLIHEADKLTSSKTMLSNTSYLKNMNSEFKKFANGDKYTDPDRLAIDGFVERTDKKKKEENKINIPGCIVKELDHTMVKKLVINEVCLGYMYIECDRNIIENNQTTFSSTLGGLRPRRSTRDRENMDRPGMDDQVLINIAKQISEKIDANFINANQDLSKEIYGILKYNADHSSGKVSKIRVSFIPPEDMIHSYFEINEKTHRGVSDLHLSLFPAKLLSCMYISNVIALITRGYDKRAYYVRQMVDTNVQGILLNVINQIKQSNFNLRQIENMNNIFNITGRFNDFVIPQSADGQSPISFEIIPGQNIEIKTDFMKFLEETAILLTGITMDMIDTMDQVQTATHITMTNARFLIDVFERQMIYQDILSDLFTKIYQIEYGVEDEVQVTLPPPAMLNFNNTSQLLSVANELIQNIVLMKLGQENSQASPDDVALRTTFTGKLMEHYFKSFLPMEEIEKMYDEAKTKVAQEKSEDNAAQQQPGMGGYQ